MIQIHSLQVGTLGGQISEGFTIRKSIIPMWNKSCYTNVIYHQLLGLNVEALANHKIHLAEVGVHFSTEIWDTRLSNHQSRVLRYKTNCDLDGVPPQRGVCREPPEPDGHLAEDVEEEVVVVVAFCHGDNLQDNLVAETVERRNSGHGHGGF